MQSCSVKLSAASLLSDLGLRDQQLWSDCYFNFQSLQMFVSDTVTNQIFAFICKADLVFTPHTPCSPRNVNFFMQSTILYLIGPMFAKECSRRSSVHFQDQRFFTEETIAFPAVLQPSFKNRIFLSHKLDLYKMRRQQRIVQKCRSRLHWIYRLI